MKFLLISGSNSLSHVAKCVVLERALRRRGHVVMVGVSREYRTFLTQLSVPHATLPDIQEADGGALPSFAWFRSPEVVQRSVSAEIDLVRAYRPHRVLGIFRFTAKISAACCSVPYDALACGCMMPDAGEVLGFGPGDHGADEQALYLDNFFRFAGRKIGMVMDRQGLAAAGDIRELLEGDRTFLWDFPRFMPLAKKANRVHIGPLSWHSWHVPSPPAEPFAEEGLPGALVTFGTRQASHAVVDKTVRCLIACGYNVTVACGGNRALMEAMPQHRRIRCLLFTPLRQLLPRTDLVVCHGGQMTIFESLGCGVPVLVVPSQPEQAHNGVCLERIRCGGRLSDPVPFKGETDVYAGAFLDLTDDEVISRIQTARSEAGMAAGLDAARRCLAGYGDSDAIARMIEDE